ncbi:hypothetical protein ACHHYP_10632 [Achlya hypogyna]|uniref:PX domain-containing protein n=1 Tax=Achlya hypogyna TaxID=1202772 RepID=A0A1V9YKT1_ACHHY|nr:hypothetical protein ACHHYP_10632 [Achlya hypogyna]
MSVFAMKTSISHVATAPEVRAQYVVRVADPRTETTAWFLYKRYSEFRTFRDALVQLRLCTACRRTTQAIVEQFPRRHIFSSKTERVLDERKIRLNHFLEIVASAVQRCDDTSCIVRSLWQEFLDVPDLKKRPLRRMSAAALANTEATSLLEFVRKDRGSRGMHPRCGRRTPRPSDEKRVPSVFVRPASPPMTIGLSTSEPTQFGR